MPMRSVETPGEDLTPSSFRKALLGNGCILLRNAVANDILGPLAAAAQAMMDHFDAIPRDVLQREMIPDQNTYLGSLWQQILDDGVHYNYDLVAFTQGRHSLFEVVRNTGLRNLASEAFPEMTIQENRETTLRRVYGAQAMLPEYSDLALAPHIDAMVHQHRQFGINFWTPLTDAGINEPGLGVIPIGMVETLDYLEYNPDGYEEQSRANLRYYRHSKLRPGILAQHSLEFLAPEMHPGDVLAFSTYAIHATSLRPEMTKGRMSIEARVLVGPIEPLIPEAMSIARNGQG